MSTAPIEALQEQNTRLKHYILNRDARVINLACDGMGTDDDLLIEVVCARTKAQLQQVKQAYYEKYHKYLADELKSECGGNYGRFLQYLLMDRAEFDAYLLSDAMEGVGCNEELVAEIFLTRSAAELRAMRTAWEGKHGGSLLERLKNELGGDFENFILRLLQHKNDGNESNPQLAVSQANELYEAGPGRRFGTDEEPFLNILSQSSRPQIELIKREYEQRRGQTLEKCLQKEFGGQVREALTGILQDPIDYLCHKLRQAFKGLGTDEATVTRIIGGYDKAGVEVIAGRYREKYNRVLAADIESEMGGNLRKALLTWVNGGDITQGLYKLTATPAADAATQARHLQDEQDALRNCLASWDATLLRRACKGVGTDEQAVIDIICKRTKEQMTMIDNKFRERFGTPLRALLESELSGDFKKFAVYTQMEEDEFDASLLREAMSGLGTNEDLLLEVLTTRSYARFQQAREYYEKRYDENLLDRINRELGGDLKKVATRLLRDNRDAEAGEFDPDAEATVLHEASVGRTFGTDEAKFIQIFTKRSVGQLQRINAVFESKYGRSLIGVVEKEFSGDLKDALLALSQDPVDYFAARLKQAFAGVGTDEEVVARILGGNNKATVFRIAERYFQKYNVHLVESLKNELAGSFRRAAMTWVSGQDPTRGADEAQAVEIPDDDVPPANQTEDLVAAAAAAEAAPAPVTVVNVVVVPELPPAPPVVEEVKDDDAPTPDDEAAAAAAAERRLQEEARRAAILAHKQAVLAQKQQQKQQQQELQRRQAAVTQLVQSRAEKAKAKLATIQGARLPASGFIVGTFDAEAYLRVNGAQGDAWHHFLETGFNEGCLLTVRTPVGLFAGIFDFEVYLQRNGIEPVRGDQAPFHPQQQAYTDLRTKSADYPLPIRPAIAISVVGQFCTPLYYQANPDAIAYSHKPRPGAFDAALYLKIHRDVRADALNHFIAHGLKQRREIVVNGRRGKLDKRWYKRTHDTNKVKKHLQKRPNSRLKVKGRRMDGWQHYSTYGHAEGRRIRIINGLGVFEGVFDEQGYLALNTDLTGGAWEHYKRMGHQQGRPIVLANVQLVSLFASNFEEANVEPTVDARSLAPPADLSSDESGSDDDGSSSDED